MADDNRKQTAFRCEEQLLTEFQIRVKRAGTQMSPVIEGWIAEFMSGEKPLPQLYPAKLTCPICSAVLDIKDANSPRVLEVPARENDDEIPESLKPLVQNFINFVTADQKDERVVLNLLIQMVNRLGAPKSEHAE